MKIFFKTIGCIMMTGAMVCTVSCSKDFLDETKRDAISSSYLETPEGLHSLSESLYIQFKYMFTNESGYCYTDYGTDEFMVAGDNSNEMWNTYDARLGSVVTPTVNSNTQAITTFWDTMYSYIARCNRIINTGEQVMDGYTSKNEVMGTAYFVRGFNYLFLTMQFGDIPLILEYTTTPQREYTRNAQSEVYTYIIEDLKQAVALLPERPSATNKLTRYAAAHYLAKAYLWRASEINDSWNSATKADDLVQCINYAEMVIAAHPLTPNYEDLFGNFDDYDTSITETNTEVVLAASNTGHDATLRSSANMMLCNFTAWYQSFPFMKRDIAGAREYQRLKTTPSYAYYLYDLKNDSRFWKSFKTTYAENDCYTNSSRSASTITLGDGSKVTAGDYYDSDDGKYMAAMYIINRKDYGQKYLESEVNIAKAPAAGSYTRVDYTTGKYIPTIMALNIYDESGSQIIGTSMTPDFNTLLAPLNKYFDGAVNANNLGNGYRDGVLARSAEDYFFKAEALIRQGKIDDGLAALKPLRDRAQYKAGEKRDEYMDGGQAYHSNRYKSTLSGFTANCAFYPLNSYYYSLGLDLKKKLDGTASTLPTVTSGNYPAEDVAIMDKLGYTSEYDKAMCYLLNEKSREMYGELLRWMDLARTKTLAKRLVFNDQAYSSDIKDITGHSANIDGTPYVSNYGGSFRENQHYYRPIPQTFLDNITKDGKPLSTEEKKALQNEGY